ncbi:hypothetical protein LTR94_024636 [Friedmanniomyces endolithicus]|nr:hypothetical protein LTR94_024636 [Friedmanniomyces endolithicus]
MIARLRPVPFDLGPVHFVGIGGIGMSGIAEIMLKIGYSVQGSDAKASANTERLEQLGARIFIGHDAAHIGEGVSAVVYSTAVKAENPEMKAARERRIPLVRRAEMLAELMRLQFSIGVGGTHGKTTTTSMVAALLDAGSLDPTVVNGGIINAYGTNAKVGEGDWMVVEADESDGSFLRLKCTVAIITNIDPEHLDHYGDFDAVKKAFGDFIEDIPFYGFGVVCLDHPEVQKLAAQIDNRRLVTYGLNPQAMVRADNVRMDPDGSRFDVVIQGQGMAALGEPARIENLHLPMAGWHNVSNALAAIAVAREIGVDEDAIRAGLAGFGFAEEGCAHFWVESDTAILDLGLSYLPNEASYPVARMPAAAWGPIDRLPAYLRYRPTQQFPEDVGFSPDPVIRDRANAFVAECRARWATQKGHLPHPTWIMTGEVAVAAAARRKDPWALGALRFASMTDLADLPF